MPLTNTDLRYYDSNVLRLSSDKRTEYHAQVDRLIAELRKHVTQQSDLKITRVVKAGSFAKYTILKKTADDPIDVDVVFYISGRDVESSTLETLSELIHSLLLKIYPTKSVEDFEIQRRAATVTFVGSGLSVDVVPVIQDEYNQDHGWQYDLSTGEKNLTCAPCQLQFVQDRKKKDDNYRTLVRMAKRWKNFSQPPGLKSFHIELILAYLLDRDGATDSIEKRFRDFLLYIAQSELKERIDFVENQGRHKSFSDPVQIVDPANHENNVASRITDEERKKIVRMADEAWEIANHASTQPDEETWKEVFGPRFKTKD
ncbi:CBASS oligonucleotide cyclase [Pandoraea apista]|uniref:CBASS oligonucleotide cyclase n=1 Tax=Pandoraea apista TaxID=93218 RepID=UPI00058AA714|nr:CBASS oligonucleotide cyclase [Pandoraea apista]AJE98842.1 nucleotidyltransferase [Pandoraea apista]AKH72921.1 nucleotidyltransferase [Pandoraea apista]AKI61306.1 nucleotidyltransferase [Pandoraea apista]